MISLGLFYILMHILKSTILIIFFPPLQWRYENIRYICLSRAQHLRRRICLHEISRRTRLQESFYMFPISKGVQSGTR